MKATTAILAATAMLTAGCANMELMTEQRQQRGLVVILPGIEGEGANAHGIRDGLVKAGAPYAIMIHPWGWPVPGLGMMLNQTDGIGNRAAGKRVAQVIADYQDHNPGQPVYVIGHSGGGGVAVFTAEGMPDGKRVDGLILLSASISANYDLSKALGKCRRGIANFYSVRDGILPACSVVGCVDGTIAPAAGLGGFRKNFPRLYQVGWNSGMQSAGNYGGHMDTCAIPFVAEYIGPWVTGYSWPAR